MAIRIIQKPVVHSVVHAPTVVHKAEPAVVHNKRGEDRYRDADARRAYKREWMRKRRAGENQ